MQSLPRCPNLRLDLPPAAGPRGGLGPRAVYVLASHTLTTDGAGDLGLVTLAVVLEAARPLAIASLVVSKSYE